MHTFVDGELLTAEQLNGNFQDIDTRTDSRLTALESSTSWTKIPGRGIWENNSDLSYYRLGRTVHLQGKLQHNTSSLGVNDYTNAFQLPVGVRPLRDIFQPVALRFTGAIPNYKPQAVLQITTEGWGHLFTEVAGANAALIGAVVWPI